ncbi:NTP transferase domain-containing protein [Pimelobacter simplex]|nr:NTP transferase domain-containing protein [Pimelobacter simplex]
MGPRCRAGGQGVSAARPEPDRPFAGGRPRPFGRDAGHLATRVPVRSRLSSTGAATRSPEGARHGVHEPDRTGPRADRRGARGQQRPRRRHPVRRPRAPPAPDPHRAARRHPPRRARRPGGGDPPGRRGRRRPPRRLPALERPDGRPHRHPAAAPRPRGDERRRRPADRLDVSTHGLLLAAGAGTRMGLPKALVRDASGIPWLTRSVEVLRAGGCSEVTVVLGASADEAASLLADDPALAVVRCADWASGMGASLRAGLEALAAASAVSADDAAALVHLVDLPDVTASVVRRVLAQADGAPLARAAYDGKPGHPVLLGRAHWAAVAAAAVGDRGARDYLAAHADEVVLVECRDLATGADVDRR